MPFSTKIYLCFLVSLLLSCSQTARQTSEQAEAKQSLETIKVEFAKGFAIETKENYIVLSVLRPYTDKQDTLRYILGKDKKNVPTHLQKTPFIQIPIRKIITTSTTHLALLDALDATDLILASNSLDYVYSERLKKLVREKKISRLADQNLEIEKIIALQPDVVMVSAMPQSQQNAYQKIIGAGIPVLINAEWLEQSPLGKAEWLKVMGILVGKSETAETIFGEVRKKYEFVKNLAKKVPKPLLVAVGTPQKDIWYVPAGGSFAATFLRDANVDYPFFQEKGTGSLPLAKELAFSEFMPATIWLNANLPAQADSSFFDDFKQMKSVQNKQIFSQKNRISPNGGNDYWESGVVHPERILSDLVKIAYPHLLPSEPFYYYKNIYSK